jgi:hypothetical protein
MNWFYPIAPLLLHDIKLGNSDEFTRIVHGVHRAIDFFARPYIREANEASEYSDDLDIHCESLLDLGRFIEREGLPDKLLSSNLHMCCCRLRAQCL